MSVVYLAFVSPRPSAIAVKLKTLSDNKQMPNLFYFWYTPNSKNAADRLKNFLIKYLSINENQIYLLDRSTSLDIEWLEKNISPENQILFDADSGLAFVVAETITLLSQTRQSYDLLHADFNQLTRNKIDNYFELQKTETIELKGLGLDPLLELYDLKLDYSPYPDGKLAPECLQPWSSLLTLNHQNQQLAIAPSTFKMDLAFESKGNLFLACVLNTDIKKDDRREHIRQFLAHYEVNHLKPVLGIIYEDCFNVPDKHQNERENYKQLLQGAPNFHILDTQQSLTSFAQAKVNLNSTLCLDSPTILTTPQSSAIILICALGTDPDSTLTAIQTHIAEHQVNCVILIYDNSTPEVQQQQNRFKQKWKKTINTHVLVQFFTSDFWFSNYHDFIEQCCNLFQSHKILINITPGSKVQTSLLSLAYYQLQGVNSKLELWSMNYTNRKATKLDAKTNPADCDLRISSLVKLAYLRSGEFSRKKTGQIQKPINYLSSQFIQGDNSKWLEDIYRLYLAEVNSQKENYHLTPIVNVHKQPASMLICKESSTCRKNACLNVNECIRYPGNIPSNLILQSQDGKPFELVIAHRLHQLLHPLSACSPPAKMSLQALWFGVQFSYSDLPGKEAADIDLMARIGKFIWSIECKSGRYDSLYSPEKPDMLQKIIGKVRHDAFRFLGRKAVPILVVPYKTQEMLNLCPPDSRFAMLLDLKDFECIHSLQKVQTQIESYFNES